MRYERKFRSSDGKTDIHVLVWVPDGNIRGVVQIAHGMVEFIERYDRFACFLADRGYVVCGNDHLGHGHSVTDDEQLGFFREKDGNRAIISDMRRLQVIMKKRYPDVPYYLIGHSMGSFFSREYMEIYGSRLDGVVLLGTGSYPPAAVEVGKALCRSRAAVHGWHYRSKLVNGLAVGSANKHIESPDTPYDWISRDKKMVAEYAVNPLTTFCFTVNGFYSMFTAIGKAQNKSLIGKIPKDLPILFVSGTEDPVGDYTEGVKKAYNALRKAGLTKVRLRFFEGDRHEVLNELNYEEVYEYLAGWLDEHSAASQR